MEKNKMVKVKKGHHPTWEETCMKIAQVISKRSHCEWVEVGAVIASMDPGNEKPLTEGYNGPPRGIAHCDMAGIGCHCRDDEGNKISGKFCIGAHAEMNAINNAAREKGTTIENATLFVTLSPCRECAKHIINSGITGVVYLELYSEKFPDKKNEEERAIELLRLGNVNCRRFTGTLQPDGQES